MLCSPVDSTSDDESLPAPAHRLPSGYSGYAASKELSADEAPKRIPGRPTRPGQRSQVKHCIQESLCFLIYQECLGMCQ